MEENNFIEDAQPVVAEPVAEPVAESVVEPVVEAPMPETKVEEQTPTPEVSAWEKYKVTAAEENKNAGVITTDNIAQGSNTVQGMGSVANGVIGATLVEKTPEKPAAPQKKTVAIHSTKNVSLPGVGKVYRGYNIVTPDQAEAWLKRSHIRLATSEEVAEEFGR
jgi:hypothetical protein